MIVEKVMEQVQKEDLFGDVQIISEIIGLEAAKKLVKELAGMTLYIAKDAFSNTAKRYIIQNSHLGVKQLVRDTDLTEVQVYKILASRGIDLKAKTIPIFSESE